MVKLRQKSMLSHAVKPFFVVLLICGLLGIVRLRSNIISVEYSISELENKRISLLRETQRLMAEKASLSAIQQVDRTASRNLGLIFPDRTKVIYVRANKAEPHNASAGRKDNNPNGQKSVKEQILSSLHLKKAVYSGTFR